MENGVEITDEKEVADVFNQFLVDKIKVLKDNITLLLLLLSSSKQCHANVIKPLMKP